MWWPVSCGDGLPTGSQSQDLFKPFAFAELEFTELNQYWTHGAFTPFSECNLNPGTGTVLLYRLDDLGNVNNDIRSRSNVFYAVRQYLRHPTEAQF
jgi:hypothetical protein